MSFIKTIRRSSALRTILSSAGVLALVAVGCAAEPEEGDTSSVVKAATQGDDSTECTSCIQQTCEAEIVACFGSQSCLAFAQCTQSCDGSPDCFQSCLDDAGSEEAQGLIDCAQQGCPDACTGGGGGCGGDDNHGGGGEVQCEECLEDACGQPLQACLDDQACASSIECLEGCEDDQCVQQCMGNVDPNLVQSLYGCAAQNCPICIGQEGGGGGTGGGGQTSTCEACVQQNCVQDGNACQNDMTCMSMVECLGTCGPDDDETCVANDCANDCHNSYPSQAGDAVLGCVEQACADECFCN